MKSQSVRVLFLITLLISLANAFHHKLHHPNYVPNRSVMVHLFEWKWNDIADECERYLAPNGFAGVQVSPVTENVIVENRPWWERYQPISYRLVTRSGDENEFMSMVDRCNRVGVRIYVDVLINHMTGKEGKSTGTGGSTADVDNLYFPAIPYGPEDFHFPLCTIKNWNDPIEVRVCGLVGLPDLNQTNERTRDMIVQSMNELLAMGVAGFRVDAAKHMWPHDLYEIYGRLNDLRTEAFPANSRPFIYQEVIDLGGEEIKNTEYSGLGVVTEFKFAHEIGKAFKGRNDLKWMRNWGSDWGFLPSQDALVFIDNHDSQRSNEHNILTHQSRERYIMATAFMLAHPYGHPQVMSSFEFESFDQGPPTNVNGEIISPKINSTSEQCENGWVCEHRWPEIRNMVKFRSVVGTAPVSAWWDNNRNQIAFCRGTRGFVAFNNEQYELNAKLFTCMPSGVYCDIITGQLDANGKCTGNQIVVDENGEADIRLASGIGVLAIHIGARIDLQPEVIIRL